jgi:hypothetical protein
VILGAALGGIVLLVVILVVVCVVTRKRVTSSSEEIVRSSVSTPLIFEQRLVMDTEMGIFSQDNPLNSFDGGGDLGDGGDAGDAEF